jgi:hypothetical protein
VAVVCAGAKAILDLRLTLEYLETHGVPVVGYGTDELPAFYSRRSGLPVDRRLDTPQAVAALLRAQWGAGLGGGVVVANPIAAEHELPRERMELIIAQALQDAQRRGVLGKDVTPFLLGRVVELSDGASLGPTSSWCWPMRGWRRRSPSHWPTDPEMESLLSPAGPRGPCSIGRQPAGGAQGPATGVVELRQSGRVIEIAAQAHRSQGIDLFGYEAGDRAGGVLQRGKGQRALACAHAGFRRLRCTSG